MNGREYRKEIKKLGFGIIPFCQSFGLSSSSLYAYNDKEVPIFYHSILELVRENCELKYKLKEINNPEINENKENLVNLFLKNKDLIMKALINLS